MIPGFNSNNSNHYIWSEKGEICSLGSRNHVDGAYTWK